jgi:hypothetical protein
MVSASPWPTVVEKPIKPMRLKYFLAYDLTNQILGNFS